MPGNRKSENNFHYHFFYQKISDLLAIEIQVDGKRLWLCEAFSSKVLRDSFRALLRTK